MKKLLSGVITFVILILTPFGFSHAMGSTWTDWLFASSLLITAIIAFFNISGDGLIGRLDKSTVKGKTGITARIDNETEVFKVPFAFYVSSIFTIGSLIMTHIN
ncbi:hypothetical protein [Gottfriedia acidiceleris]|uniref:Phosphatidate cytidylyltransferase n=1 Tax=Gottfriedia acidiceleris TaxID=371036 RepID=A0ABY4JR05_9BACI|nr:hypothetical protein [Gottfriedia acidiceleris]UPM56263.1 hypothetical protein MY490_10680 [Gottfriedia acidiceleris]